MAVCTVCPTPAQLQKFAMGMADEAELDSLPSHIQDCEKCGAVLSRLNGSDALAEVLHKVPRVMAQLPRGAVVERAIERACRLVGSPRAGSRRDMATDETSGFGPETSRNDAKSSPESLAELAAQVLSPPRQSDELGRLGPYRVLKLLDAGGMGMVFLAEDPRLQRRVALKVMKPTIPAAEDARQRFLREARAAAALRHDNIVTIYEVSGDARIPWFAMELLEGQSLHRRLAGGQRLSAGEAVAIGRQIAQALALAHARGLIHRDIKPANIWLEMPTGRVKILDFGLARSDSDDSQLTRTGVFIGTPAYMAPEQARGEKVDHRCDLFSLGCVLYHMLAGSSPFRGKDTMAVLTALIEHSPPSLPSVGVQVPASLDRLIGDLLAKDPPSRPRSAMEVDAILERVQGELMNGQPAKDLIPEVHPFVWPGRAPGSDSAGRAHRVPGRASRNLLIAAGIVAAVLLISLLGLAVALYVPQTGAAAKADTALPARGGFQNDAPVHPEAAAAMRTPAADGGKSETAAQASPETGDIKPRELLAQAAARSTGEVDEKPNFIAPNRDRSASIAATDPAPPDADSGPAPLVPGLSARSPLPKLVSIQTTRPLQVVVGELIQENDTHLELADLKTGQAKSFARADLRGPPAEASKDTAIRLAGLPSYVAWEIQQALPRADVKGRIVDLDGPTVWVSLGKGSGIEAGQQLNVYRRGEEIKDPATGKVLDTQRRKIAVLQVTDVRDAVAKAKLLGDLETRLEKLDDVEPVAVNNLVAVLPLAGEDDEEGGVGKQLMDALHRRGVPLVERKRLADQVLGELRRQQGVEFDAASAQKVGRQLGAYAVVVGTRSNLRLVRVETGQILVNASAPVRDAGASESALPKRSGKIAALPRASRGSPIRWLAGTVDSAATVAGIAPIMNIIQDRCWLSGDDSAIQEARRAGRPVILSFFRTDYPACTELLLKMAKDNRDVVAGVCLLSPYYKNEAISPNELSKLGQRLKKELPGISYWVSYIDLPAGWSEPLPPVPPEVDVIEVEVYWGMNPAAVTQAVDKNFGNWIRRANGRPVVLCWVSLPALNWSPRDGFQVRPGTFRRCLELASRYKLAGVAFNHFGTRRDNHSPAIDSLPAAMEEIKELSRLYGFARD
jgi:serine/threonine protein kinase